MNASVRCLALIASLSVGTAVHAADPDEARLKPRWEALDANHDGKVTLDELGPRGIMMKRADSDGDGAISLAEYVAFDHDPAGAARLPVPENVRIVADLPYAATSDPRQTLDVYVPRKPSVKGPLPVVAYIHGGGWSTGHKIMARAQVMNLVSSGRYAAVSIGYRLSWQAPWPAQIHDVKAGIRWIRANAGKYGFDPKRICAMGPSAGGHLVAELGTTNGEPAAEGKVGTNLRQSSKVQCVIDMMGPTDLRSREGSGSGGGDGAVVPLLGGKASDKAQLAADASPVTHVDRTDPPFLIIHGTKDPVVNFQQSVALDKALREAGVPVIFVPVEGGGHGDFGAATAQLEPLVRAFLEKTFYDPSVKVPADPLHR
jgi:acetyl esterase/lipase